MSITWRTELHFTCDNAINESEYNPECYGELMLDQMDAKTKKGMFAIAKKAGWEVEEKTLCPACKLKQAMKEK